MSVAKDSSTDRVSDKLTVLFLCVGNSARSQMAEALLRKHAGDRFDVHSAGLRPKPIHPFTIQVLSEIGIDMTGKESKSVQQFLGKLPVHYIISVCAPAEAECPTIWPGPVKRLSWPFDDPVAFSGTETEQLNKFRTVRDQIDAQIRSWLVETLTTELH